MCTRGVPMTRLCTAEAMMAIIRRQGAARLCLSSVGRFASLSILLLHRINFHTDIKAAYR